MPSTDRTAIATTALGAAFVSYVAYVHPVLIPVLTLGVAVAVAMYAFMKR